MAHAQKPDFVFPRTGRVHLSRCGRQFSRLLEAEVWASAWVMLDNHVRKWRENTGYPLHSPVSPSLPLPCVKVCHQVPNELYHSPLSLTVLLHRFLAMTQLDYSILLKKPLTVINSRREFQFKMWRISRSGHRGWKVGAHKQQHLLNPIQVRNFIILP